MVQAALAVTKWLHVGIILLLIFVQSLFLRKGAQRVRNIRDRRGEDTFIRKTSLVKDVG